MWRGPCQVRAGELTSLAPRTNCYQLPTTNYELRTTTYSIANTQIDPPCGAGCGAAGLPRA